MIVYNVTLKVHTAVADEWVKWMKTDHMPELMRIGLFTDCRLCRILEQDETEDITYTAQYTCKGIEDYDTYIAEYADGMRSKMLQLFGSKIVAFRTIMEII